MAVGRELYAFLLRFRLSHKPRFVLGASSGGTFATVLARVVQMDGVCVQISPGHHVSLSTRATRQHDHTANALSRSISGKHVQQAHAQATSADIHSSPVVARAASLVSDIFIGGAADMASLPDTAFVYMSKDRSWATAERVSSASDIVRHAHGSRSIALNIDERPLTSEWLAERVDEVDASLSSMIYTLAVSERYRLVDPQTGMIRANPSHTRQAWASVIRAAHTAVPTGFDFNADDIITELMARVGEELALLWAEHELVSDSFDQVFEWWLAGLDELEA
jgi:hypothetical protein